MYTGLRPLSVPIVLHHLPTGGIGSRAVTILSLLKGRPLSEACQGLDTALRFAAAAAGLSCMRAGADPPRLQEIEGFLRR